MKFIRFGYLNAAFLAAACALWACATAAPAMAQGAADAPLGVPQDWSHRHVIYSNPDTLEEAAAKGTLDKWLKKADDPRFVLQLEKKLAKLQAKAAADAQADALATAGSGARKSALAADAKPAKDDPKPAKDKKQPPPTPTAESQIHRDWSNVMGGVSGTGDVRNYPAKFSFTTSTKSCTSDFVVFTTSTAGATSAGGAGAFYTQTATFANPPAAGGTLVITTNATYAPPQVLTLTADASVNVGLKFAVGASATAAATNLANAIARNGGTWGLTATSSGAVVTITSVTANVTTGQINYTNGLSNFTLNVETSGAGGTKGQPTIFALNQLYADTVANTGCQTATQAVPAVYWSYTTGTGAIADLSPVLSFFDNGAQVAFMQHGPGNVSSLVLLKWSSASPGTIGAPTIPATAATAAAYRTCTAPCMLVMALSGNPLDTNSSPYVDYTGDTLYVGDDTGKLHKFTGVFAGTPAEVISGWPVQVAATTSLMSSPVFDGASTVYIGSNGPVLATGNKLHRVDTGTGAVTSSGNIGSASAVNGIRDAPILDTGAGKVYAFQGAFTSAGPDSLGNATCTGGICNTVFQFPTGFTAGNTGSFVFVGAADATLNSTMNSGAFNDAYYSSGGASGALFVCGSQSATAGLPTLWKITMAAGAFSARTLGPQLSGTAAADNCSPPTVFANGSTEIMYVSVSAGGIAAGGSGCTAPATGCLYAYQNVNTFDATSASSTIPASDNASRFMSVSTTAALNTTESLVVTTVTAGQAGTYLGMTITQPQNPNKSDFTYTLRKNGADTAITCVVTGNNATACSDTTHTASYAAGDTIDVRVQRTADIQALGPGTFRVQLGIITSAAINANGGTGGIVVDNTLTGGGSQVYFSTRQTTGTLGIAVQASQGNLN